MKQARTQAQYRFDAGADYTLQAKLGGSHVGFINQSAKQPNDQTKGEPV